MFDERAVNAASAHAFFSLVDAGVGMPRNGQRIPFVNTIILSIQNNYYNVVTLCCMVSAARGLPH